MISLKKILVVIILINNLSSNCASFKINKKRNGLGDHLTLTGHIEPSTTPIHDEAATASPAKKNCPFSISTGLNIDTKIEALNSTETAELMACPSSGSPQFLAADLAALIRAESPKHALISSASIITPSKLKRPNHLSVDIEKSPGASLKKSPKEDYSPKSATLCLALDVLGEKNILGDNTLNIVRQDITPPDTPASSALKPENPFGCTKTKRSRIEIGAGLYSAMLASPRLSPEVAGFLKSPNILQKKS